MQNRKKTFRFELNSNLQLDYEAPESAIEKFQPGLHAVVAEAQQESAIDIYSMVGDYGYKGDVTVDIMNEFLKKNKGKNVTVNINSPGGDYFHGVAIYNLLRDHTGEVNVNVIGIAASAASVIAMAGDQIKIAESAQFMIHNAWTMALGNRHTMAQVGSVLEKFDNAMAGVYVKRTGMKKAEIEEMMDEESWISGSEAVEAGFATELMEADKIELDESVNSRYISNLRTIDNALAKQNMPRAGRRSLIKELTGTPSAAEEPKPSAGVDEKLIQALNGLVTATTIN